MPMLRRPHAHHRDLCTRLRAEAPAGHRAPRDQDRYVMIEITLSTTTQRRPVLPFSPPTVNQRRRRSPADAAPTAGKRRPRTLPSTAQLVKLQGVRRSDLSTTDPHAPQIPIDRVGVAETEPLPAR